MKLKALKKSKNKSTNKNLRRVSLFELQNSPKALLFRARAQHLSSITIQLPNEQKAIVFRAIIVVRECNIKYLKSAKFEDNLEIKTKVINKSPVRFNLLQEVSKNNEILVTAQVELAVIGSNGSVSKIPKDLLEKI